MLKNTIKMKKTELEKEFQQLQIREELFRTIAESVPVMLWITDDSGKSQYFNRTWKRFTGLAEDSPPISAWTELLHPDDKKHCLASFMKVFKAQLPFQMEYRMRRFDGEYRWMLDVGEPRLDCNGRFAGYVGSSQDITERKQAEQDLRFSYQELERHNHDNALLSEMNSCLQVCHSMQESYTVIGYFAKRLFTENSGMLFLINESRSLVEMLVEWGNKIESETVFSLQDCWSLRQGKPHCVTDPQNGLLCNHVKKDLSASYICLPLSAFGETMGIVHMQLPSHSNWDDAQKKTCIKTIKHLCGNFANHVALALANLKLREALQHQSVRDPLTQLYNRRYLLESMEQEFARAKRNKTSVGTVMIDVDHFKQYNDTYGHDAGDAVLRELGGFLKLQTRKEDILCRYGGEEFVMVMAMITIENLKQRCEDIREAVSLFRIEHRGQPLGNITISMGAALYPQQGETIEELINAADAALYQAKRSGRNRLILADNNDG